MAMFRTPIFVMVAFIFPFLTVHGLSPKCSLSRHTDICNNQGVLLNCSHFGINRIHGDVLPEVTEYSSITIDLSYNDVTILSSSTFKYLNFTNVTSILLHHNNIKKVEDRAFTAFTHLCGLDISSCNLTSAKIAHNAFKGLNAIEFLKIHDNSFQRGGYPDVALSHLVSLKSLMIDAFKDFHFTKENFKKLSNLNDLNLRPQGIFDITNSSFFGLSYCPIEYLTMDFSNHLQGCNLPNFLCSFSFLKWLLFRATKVCSLDKVLSSLKCLQGREMEYINLDRNILEVLDQPIDLNNDISKYLLNISVKKLILSNNGINSLSLQLHGTALQKSLESIDFTANAIDRVSRDSLESFFFVSKLREIRYCCNDPQRWCGANIVYRQTTVGKFWEIVHDYSTNFLEPGINMRLSSNRISTTISISLLHIQYFDFSNNYIHRNTIKLFIYLSCPKLIYLNLKNTFLELRFLKTPNMPLLNHLDISTTFCNDLPENFFQYMRQLRTFTAQNCGMNETLKYHNTSIFASLGQLQFIDIGNNGIDVLNDKDLFKYQAWSLEHIVLNDNYLDSLPLALTKLSNISILEIRKNRISTFTDLDIKHLQKLKIKEIFMQGNPMTCACSSRKWLQWMRNNQHMFSDLHLVECIDLNSDLKALFKNKSWRMYTLKCIALDWLIFSITSLTLTSVILVSVALIRKYRLHLDYLMLTLKRRWFGLKTAAERRLEFIVYISYAETDAGWVKTSLHTKMSTFGIETILQDKDFIPGEFKAQQIVNYIDQSSKVVFVVTENFLQSGWSSYEVQMAITHAFHSGRQNMIVVLIKDDIPLKYMPDELKNIWWTISYIRWPMDENPLEMDRFWTLFLQMLNREV